MMKDILRVGGVFSIRVYHSPFWKSFEKELWHIVRNHFSHTYTKSGTNSFCSGEFFQPIFGKGMRQSTFQ